MDAINASRKRSRSPERREPPYSATSLPPIAQLPSFNDRRGPSSYPTHGPTSAPRFSEPNPPNAPSPSHFSSRTPPQLHTGYQPPQPARQSQQSLPSLSEVMGAPGGPLKSLVAPGGLIAPNNHHHSYSAPGSQTTSPHPSNPDQRSRGYEHQSFGSNDVYARQQSQYSNGYSAENRSEHPGGRYPPTTSPLTPISSHSSSPYGSAPPHYSHDHYRGPDPHFIKKDTGMSTAIPPYGPSAEKALVYSVLKQDAQHIGTDIIPLLERYPKTIFNLEHGGSVQDVIKDAEYMMIAADKIMEMAKRGIAEAREYEVRAQHVNAMPEQRVHHQSQPPRGSPYNSYKTTEDVYEDQKRFAQPDQKRARRGRAAPPGRCHSCNRSETPEWRRGPDGARTLCNACGLHFAKISRKNQKNGVTSSS